MFRHPGWRAAAALLLCAAALPAARAALFEDDEARKAVLELRGRVQANEAARAKQAETNAELAKANAALLEQVQQLRRSLLELNNQLELLRTDLAKQRGTDEQLARDIAEVQRRQKDISSVTQGVDDRIKGVDDRIKRLEPIRTTVDGREFMADPEEKRQFDEALALLRGGEFDKAAVMFGAFVRRYPASGYIDSARFWLGNAHYGRRDYKDAIAAFRAVASNAPDHPRAPEALLAIANCQVESKDNKGARATIGELIKVYPKSEAAQAGRERLAALK